MSFENPDDENILKLNNIIPNQINQYRTKLGINPGLMSTSNVN